MRFAADFGPKISKKFRGRKILRPESREIAPKSALPDDAKPCREAGRSSNTVPSVAMLRRVRLRAISDRNFQFFFRGRKILRSKLREIAPKSAVPHVLQPGHDP